MWRRLLKLVLQVVGGVGMLITGVGFNFLVNNVTGVIRGGQDVFTAAQSLTRDPYLALMCVTLLGFTLSLTLFIWASGMAPPQVKPVVLPVREPPYQDVPYHDSPYAYPATPVEQSA